MRLAGPTTPPPLWLSCLVALCISTLAAQSQAGPVEQVEGLPKASLLAMVERCDAIVVIGSANSSNTRALEQLAIEAGCQRVVRINSVDELPDGFAGTVGVTAGASAPDELVIAVLDALAPVEGVEVVRVTEEDEYFPPPRNIRELQSAIESASTSLLGGSLLARPVLEDRTLSASDVLAELEQ